MSSRPSNHARFAVSRLRLAAGGIFALAVALLAFVGSGGIANAKRDRLSGPLAAPTIPKATVRFGFYPCCADSSFVYVAIARNFFKDVGITITPSNGYRFSQAQQVTPAMQRGQFDFATQYIPAYLPALATFAQKIPPALFADIYLGDGFIKSPDNPAKTVYDFLAKGYSFKKAARLAVLQMKGQVVYTDPFSGAQPPYPLIFLRYAGMTYKDVKFRYLDDSKVLALAATPGRVKWWFPYNGPILVQALRSGWKAVIDDAAILKHDSPNSPNRKFDEGLIGSNGLMAQRSFLETHHDTALRFLSAIFRTLNYCTEARTKRDCWSITAQQINASQGLNLTPAAVGTIINKVDPFFPWKLQRQIWTNKKYPYYEPGLTKTQVEALIKNHTLPKRNYDLDRFLVGKKLYLELARYQNQANKLLRKAKHAKLSPSKRALVASGKRYYAKLDFLDAVRFLKAALG